MTERLSTKKAPVLLLLLYRNERVLSLFLYNKYYCTAFSAAAMRYSEGVWPVRRLNTRVK